MTFRQAMAIKRSHTIAPRSDFTVMRSGNRINVNRPRKRLVLASDIAEQLAKTALGRGATRGFYTVAQHSILVAAEAARCEGALAGMYALLHHAQDIYDPARCNDMLLNVLHSAFGLSWRHPSPALVAAIDQAHDTVTITELRQLWTGRDREIAEFGVRGVRPLRTTIRPIEHWRQVKALFLEALNVYARAADLPRDLPAYSG